MKLERELMRGAGPLAILRLLEPGERYGYELVQLLESRSNGVLKMGQSTLYPLLYNLQAKGLVASRTETADNGRPRRYYRRWWAMSSAARACGAWSRPISPTSWSRTFSMALPTARRRRNW